MPQPGNFESAVAGFLQGYSLVSGIKSQKRQDKLAAQRASAADQEATIRMNEAGYDRITMPTIEAPPDQSFTQKIGRFLSGGPEQPGSIVMKTHQSVREAEAAGARQAHLQDVGASQGFSRELEGIRAANDRKLQGEREAGFDRRNRDDNATAITVAGMNRGTQRMAQDRDDRRQFFDDAVSAAGGDAVKAMENAGQFQMGKAQRFGATRTDYHAAAQRFSERKAVLSEADRQSREDIASKKGATKDAIRARLLGPQAGQNAAPVAMSDAELWESYVDQGLSAGEATARVKARKR